MHVEFRVEMRCTPWQLWPFLDEVEKQKLWLTTLVEVVATSQVPRAVGATFDMRVREGRRISRYEGRVHAYDPPKHLGVLLWGGSFQPGVVMKVDYRVADLGASSRLEYYAEIDTESLRPPVKWAIPIARVFAFFQIRYFFGNLTRLAEAAARAEAKSKSTARRSN